MPIAFTGLYIAKSLVGAKFIVCLDDYDPCTAEQRDYWRGINIALLKTFGYCAAITNFISCLILFLTIRFAYKLTKEAQALF